MDHNAPNPYTPPARESEGESASEPWWRGVQELLLTFGFGRSWSFHRGSPIVYYGVVYFVDPKNKAVLYASIPGSKSSPGQMELLIAEALRVIPFLLRDHPELRSIVRGRSLSVRMIETYRDSQKEPIRSAVVNDSIDIAEFRTAEIGSMHPSDLA